MPLARSGLRYSVCREQWIGQRLSRDFSEVSQRQQLPIVLATISLTWATLSIADAPAKPASKAASARRDEPRQHARANDGGIAVNASGNAKVEIYRTIQRSDPVLESTLKRLEKLLEERSSASDDTRARDRLVGEVESAVNDVLHRARESNASPASLAAKRGLEKGDTLDAEVLLQQAEEVAAGGNPPDLPRAAALARQQGALALTRDTKVALAAYQRAADYEPDNADNWLSLGDLLIQSLRRDDAVRAYERMTHLVEERARRDPASPEWRRLVATGYRKMANAFLAQDDVPHATEASEKSLTLSERWAADQPANRDAQNQLILSLIQKGRVGLAGTESTLNGDSLATSATAHDRMEAIRQEITRRASEAEAQYRRGLMLVDSLLDHDVDDDYLWLQGADCHEGIAWSLALRLQRGVQGEFSRSIEILTRIANKNPRNAFYQRNLALAYRSLGGFAARSEHDAAAASSSYRKSLAILQTLRDQNPSNPQLQLDLVGVYQEMAWLAQPWVTVPSLLDPNYRDYMRRPLVEPAEGITMLLEGWHILEGFEADGVLGAPEKVLQRQIQSDLEDLRCQQQGFESAFGGQCLRPLPASMR